MNSRKAVGTVQDRPIDLFKRLRIRVDFDSGLVGVLFVQADVSDFRRRVRGPGNDQVACSPATQWTQCEQRVLNHDPCLKVGGVSELEFRTDIAGRVNAFVGGLQEVVDFNSSTIVFNIDCVKVQSIRVGARPTATNS